MVVEQVEQLDNHDVGCRVARQSSWLSSKSSNSTTMMVVEQLDNHDGKFWFGFFNFSFLGPNISFPFYIPGLQESYCGLPGFEVNCSINGFPVLHLPGKDVLVRNISYHNRTFRVYNDAVSSLNGSCLPQIRNTTLPPEKKFDYFNVSKLYLLSNCTKNLSEDLSRYKVKCVDESRDSWVAVFEGDENLKNALENCEENVVAVEVLGGEGRNGTGNYMDILRRGFVLNWTAIDCSICAESGGRCGFNESILHFKCFCPDRPHSSSCKPGKII
ncbi:putative serine/threonine-protein kinase [Forsythia ovata]|uniref:non-specific serine/threonine protein kinase n=1 Tax=Forsythia ovata TaxID=205694 RepID=A0ABD1SHT2_9LAMI